MPNQEMTSYADRSPLPAAALGDRYRRREFAPRGSSRSEKSFADEEIWGQYNNYRSNGLVGSLIVHVVVVGLVLVGATFSHQIVEQATQRQIVTLIAPSPDSYALQPNKKIVSGGGRGHRHHHPRSRSSCWGAKRRHPAKVQSRSETDVVLPAAQVDCWR